MFISLFLWGLIALLEFYLGMRYERSIWEHGVYVDESDTVDEPE